MSATQMNIRLDAALKENGDMVFSQAGYTPTQAVRLLWEFAQRNVGKPEQMRELLNLLQGGEGGKTQSDARKLARRTCRQRAKLYEEFGVPAPMRFSAPSDGELEDLLQEQLEQDRRMVDEAYASRAFERGL